MWLLVASLPVIFAIAIHYWADLRPIWLRAAHASVRLLRGPVCVRSTHAFVFLNCTHGKVQSVLETYEQYAQTHPSLAIGPEKGQLLEEAVRRVGPARILELGTHCGYSSVRILRALAPSGRLLTVEQDQATAEAGEEIILVAGFKHTQVLGHLWQPHREERELTCLARQFQVLTCSSAEAIARLPCHLGDQLLELVLMDHDVQQYLPDLMHLESQGSLASGCVLLVNDTHLPGAQLFLDHIGSNPERYHVHSLAQGLLELHCGKALEPHTQNHEASPKGSVQ